MKLSQLKKLPNNPRTIKKEQMDKLKASIKKFGVLEGRPFLISTRTGENIIIGGNQRYEACRALGIEEVPVSILDNLTEEEEKEIIIRDNISNGDWDWDMLANTYDQVKLEEWGLDVPVDSENSERKSNKIIIRALDLENLYNEIENIVLKYQGEISIK